MKHKDFHIGLEFWCSDQQWRCTDVGTRTALAIRIDAVEITTADSGIFTTTTISRKEAERRGWFSGPPYAGVEYVFDENDFAACTLMRVELGDNG